MGFFMNLIEDGIEKGFLRPLPPIALIIIVYQPIEKLIKVMETGQLEYTEELVKELEESCWNAIRIIWFYSFIRTGMNIHSEKSIKRITGDDKSVQFKERMFILEFIV